MRLLRVRSDERPQPSHKTGSVASAPNTALRVAVVTSTSAMGFMQSVLLLHASLTIMKLMYR
jgi:hypothetical protein